MGLEGQQTSLAVTQLISSLTQGYVEGMKLARDEESRLAKLKLAEEREARISASEQQRLGLAKLRFMASEEERRERGILRQQQLRTSKKRGALLSLDIQAKRRAAAATDPQLGNIGERINSNIKEYFSAKKVLDDGEFNWRSTEAAWESVKDSSDKTSSKYLKTKARYDEAKERRDIVKDRLTKLVKARDYLTMTRELYTASPVRGHARQIHSQLTSSGYSPKLAERFVVDLHIAAIKNIDGDRKPLEDLTTQLQLDNISIQSKHEIGKVISSFVALLSRASDRAVTTEPTPYTLHTEDVQTKLQEEISAPTAEELVHDDVIAARIYEKEGMLPEWGEDDPEAKAAIEQQIARTRRTYGKPESVLKPLGKRLSPLAKERLEKAKKSKREIKKSPYWRRRFQDEQMMD